MGDVSNTVWVKERVVSSEGEVAYKQIGGIPFYVKKEVFNQATSYAKTWLSATMKVEKTLISEKDGKKESIILDAQRFEKRLLKSKLTDLDAIKSSILKADVLGIEDVKSIVSDFSNLNSLVDISGVPAEQVENTLSSSWVVNENEKYYLNAPLPWFGTGNLTQELNPDGTLAKVVSSPDTKLAEGISSLIPMKEYLTGKFIDPLKDKTDEEAMAELGAEKAFQPLLASVDIPKLKLKSELIYKVSLSIVESGYIYKFTKTYEDAPTSVRPLPFDTTSQTYTRTILGATSGGGEKKDDDKSIGITGTVSYPKDW